MGDELVFVPDDVPSERDAWQKHLAARDAEIERLTRVGAAREQVIAEQELRDRFAMAALGGELVRYCIGTYAPESAETVAEACYRVADAMYAERLRRIVGGG